ncbi:MAG: homoserine dehydrogenase [Candidatus Gastranaerophilales bacterium]|nr:homoserine dehydrogenase [Candidatus Gastranaerophilales bacterium]
MDNIVKVGLLGLGTVGSGVFKTLSNFDNVEVTKISVSNINKKRNIEGLSQEILTTDSMSIVNNSDIDIIVEVIGGINPAFDLITTAIKNKKHIVTANKELIAKHGEEIFELAKKFNVSVLYEAAVAGGIPIIMPIKMALAGNKISKIAGILNGTTNFILTKMTNEKADFEPILKEAQELGYAEADPTGDIQGYDAAYKIAILASLAFGKRIDSSLIYREGIDNISAVDIEYADDMGYKIKLIALAQITENDKVDVRVHPMFVSKKLPIAYIDGVLNAIYLKGHPVGEVMFSGPGAGEFPTASSVVGDILALAEEIPYTDNPLPMLKCKHEEKAEQLDIKHTENKYYIRVSAQNTPGVIGDLGCICGRNKINLSSIFQKGILADGSARVVLLTEPSKEEAVQKAVEEMNAHSQVKQVMNVIRVMD